MQIQGTSQARQEIAFSRANSSKPSQIDQQPIARSSSPKSSEAKQTESGIAVESNPRGNDALLKNAARSFLSSSAANESSTGPQTKEASQVGPVDMEQKKEEVEKGSEALKGRSGPIEVSDQTGATEGKKENGIASKISQFSTTESGAGSSQRIGGKVDIQK